MLAPGLQNKQKHMPLFKEFRETSQDMFGSDIQVYFPWDVCRNSSKSGFLHFSSLSRPIFFANGSQKKNICHFSKKFEKRPRVCSDLLFKCIFPGTFLEILRKVAFCIFRKAGGRFLPAGGRFCGRLWAVGKTCHQVAGCRLLVAGTCHLPEQSDTCIHVYGPTQSSFAIHQILCF